MRYTLQEHQDINRTEVPACKLFGVAMNSKNGTKYLKKLRKIRMVVVHDKLRGEDRPFAVAHKVYKRDPFTYIRYFRNTMSKSISTALKASTSSSTAPSATSTAPRWTALTELQMKATKAASLDIPSSSIFFRTLQKSRRMSSHSGSQRCQTRQQSTDGRDRREIVIALASSTN
ncbi:hypothetical protein BC940DRAFT_320877 [Gongronella butleri]|nr:hypothetical protein BC940DRAFT_320877 [Gongronella butleri]